MNIMIPTWIELIGVLAGLLGVVAWLPQIRKVWWDGKHDGISLPSFGLVFIALILWLIYGLLINSLAMTISNISALTCILAIIIGVLRLRRKTI